MGLASFEDFNGADIGAFVASAAVGFFASTFAPAGPVAVITCVLVSYHMFLAWLIFFSVGHKKAGVSLPVVQTLLTHAACVILIMSPVVTAMSKHVIPTPGDAKHAETDATAEKQDPGAEASMEMESITRQRNTLRLVQALCGSIAGLAVFERRWLFSSEVAEERTPRELPSAAPAIQATAEDAAEWSRYLAQRKPGAYKAGSSLKAEYEQWLLARHRSRAAGANGG